MKALLAFIIAILIPGALHCDNEIASIVLVQNLDDATSHGSGVVVGRSPAGNVLILTARHVALLPHLRIVFSDGATSEVVRRRLQDMASGRWAGDIALLEAKPVASITAADVALTDVLPGAQLRIIGNPFAFRFFTRYARASDTVRVHWVDDHVEPIDDSGSSGDRIADSLSMQCVGCAPGDSGAGVFDGDGKLVGVMFGATYSDNDDTKVLIQAITGRYDPHLPSTGYVVPASVVRKYMNSTNTLP